MKFWIDVQLSPALAPWLNDTFGVQAFSLEGSALQQASDKRIFSAAREVNAVVITKDQDFVHLLNQLGPPTTGRLDNLVAIHQMRKCVRFSNRTFQKSCSSYNPVNL